MTFYWFTKFALSLNWSGRSGRCNTHSHHNVSQNYETAIKMVRFPLVLIGVGRVGGVLSLEHPHPHYPLARSLWNLPEELLGVSRFFPEASCGGNYKSHLMSFSSKLCYSNFYFEKKAAPSPLPINLHIRDKTFRLMYVYYASLKRVHFHYLINKELLLSSEPPWIGNVGSISIEPGFPRILSGNNEMGTLRSVCIQKYDSQSRWKLITTLENFSCF